MKLLKKVSFWLFIILIIGSVVGSASAFFLWSLNEITNLRIQYSWLVYFLPIAGFAIGLKYYYLGEKVVTGNNLLLEEFHSPKDVIPFRMAPMIYISTIVSHLFGASVGREGTAIQLGGSIADQLTHYFKLDDEHRRALIIMGISAGFASVFGTPFAAAIFAVEIFHSRKLQYKYIVQSLAVAVVAHFVCLSWGIEHLTFSIPNVPALSFMNIFWTINAGIIFGLVALLFTKSSHHITDLFHKYIKFPPYRPLIGGVIIVIVYYFIDLHQYMGLGLDSISASFSQPMQYQDFLLKLILTAFTIGVGFKGGEVTPLFFIGATLGNALIWFIPLPMPLLAGLGLVAVFAGATNTLIACIAMGLELFGFGISTYLIIACLVAYLFSGHNSIYAAQKH